MKRLFQKFSRNILASQNLFKENRPIFLEGDSVESVSDPVSPDPVNVDSEPQPELAPTRENTIELGSLGPLKVGKFLEFKEPDKVNSKVLEITGFDGEKYTLSDKSKVWVEDGINFVPTGMENGKAKKRKVMLREKGGKTYTIDGDLYDVNFVPSAGEEETLSVDEAKAKIDRMGAAAKEKLKKQLKEIPNVKEEDLKKMIEEGNAKIDGIMNKAKGEIAGNEVVDGEILKNFVSELQKIFKKETEDQLDLSEKELKAKKVIKQGKDSLFKWLKTPANRLYMRKLVFTGWDGNGIPKESLTTNFSNVETALNLDSKGKKTVWKYLRIGNLFETNQLKHINGVQKGSGKKLEPKYFTKGGPNHREGVYTKKLKYCAILQGTKIFFSGDTVLEEMKKDEGKHKEQYKKLEAQKSAPKSDPKAKVSEEVAEDLKESADKGASTEAPEGSSPDAPIAAPEEAAISAAPETPKLTTEPREIKPLLAPTKRSKEIQEFEGQSYVYKSSTQIDLYDDNQEKKSTVDKETFDVITGKEIMTQDFMLAKAKEHFNYFKVEPTVEKKDDTSFFVTFEDEAGNKIKFSYNIESKTATPVIGQISGNVTKLLKNTSEETIATLCLDYEYKVAKNLKEHEEDIEEQISKLIAKQDWTNLLIALTKKSDPNKKSIHLAINEIAITHLRAINTDTGIKTKFNKHLPATINVWRDYGDAISELDIKKMEYLSGGKLSAATLTKLGESSKSLEKETLKYLTENYPKNDAIKSLYYDNLGEAESLDAAKGNEKTSASEAILIDFYKNPPKTMSKQAIQALFWAHSWGNYDRLVGLTAVKLGVKPEELEAAKEKIITKLKGFGREYLAEVAKESNPKSFEEIYEVVYSGDFSFIPKQTGKGPAVLARYLVIKNTSPLVEGALDGTKNGKVDESKECIKIYMTLDEAKLYGDSHIQGSNEVLAKKVYETCQSMETPLAKEYESAIQRLYSDKDWIKGKENFGKSFDKLMSIATNKKITASHRLFAILELTEYVKYSDEVDKNVKLKVPNEKGDLEPASKKEFNEWLANKKVEVRILSDIKGLDKIDPAKITDPELKEFVETYKSYSSCKYSIPKLRKIASNKYATPEAIRALIKNKKTSDPKKVDPRKVELYLAIGMKGAAEKVVDKMTENTPEYFYYKAILTNDPEDREQYLMSAVKGIDDAQIDDHETVDYKKAPDQTLQIAIFEAFHADGFLPDYPTLEALAKTPTASLDEDQERAVLQAQAMRALFEVYQCSDPKDLPKNIQDKIGTTGKHIPEGADRIDDRHELVTKLKIYIDAKKAKGKLDEDDKKLLIAAYKAFHQKDSTKGKRVSTWKEKLQTSDKNTYAELMLELAVLTGQKGYLEGVDKDLFTDDSEAQAKFLGFTGNKFESKLVTAASQSGAKQKATLEEAEKLATTKEKKVKLAEKYKALGTSENLVKATKIYLGLGTSYVDSEENNGIILAANILKENSSTINTGEVKGLVDEFAKKGYGGQAEDICVQYEIYETLLNSVYKVKKDMDVKVGLLVGEDVDTDKLLEFLKTDSRLSKKFLIAGDNKNGVDKFYEDNKPKIDKLPDTQRKRIEIRLGQSASTDDEPAPEAPAEAAPETPKDHKHTITDDGRIKVEKMDDTTAYYTVEKPEDIKLEEHTSNEGDNDIYFKKGSKCIAYFELDEDGESNFNVLEDFKNRYTTKEEGKKLILKEVKKEAEEPAPEAPAEAPEEAAPQPPSTIDNLGEEVSNI